MEKIENLKTIIKENLIKYRKSAGLTQAQLAAKLGYSDKTISKWEREEGVPDIYILKEIADLYGVTVNDLITPAPTLISKIKKAGNLSETAREYVNMYDAVVELIPTLNTNINLSLFFARTDELYNP